jgi:cyclopropane-fatty-acyl-phospholipid synthase
MLTGMVRNRMLALGRSIESCFRLQLADGSQYQNRDGAPAFTIVIRNRRAYWRILLFGHIGLMESYFDADVDVEGDFGASFQAAFESGFESNPNTLVGLRNRWHELRCSNRSIAQARANAQFHYAIGTDFYRYWLDTPLMMYTCAYWKEGTTSVDEAQINKVDHVCRKIKLSRGETVIDIGCGFGGFMFHAHEHYGAVPYGLNTTPEQVTSVQQEIRKRGLEGKMEVRLADFREVDRQYDKVVSIGVLEHAGRDQLAEVVKAHADFLKPGGLGMLHFIGHVGVRDTEFYIREHVFPGGWIPSLAQTIAEMERCGLEVVDIENLRRHYAPTLDAWAERFDRNWENIRALDPKRFDDKFRRVWRTYLISCAEMFRSSTGRTHLFQIVFSKGNITRQNYPMSREFLYGSRLQ